MWIPLISLNFLGSRHCGFLTWFPAEVQVMQFSLCPRCLGGWGLISEQVDKRGKEIQKDLFLIFPFIFSQKSFTK